MQVGWAEIAILRQYLAPSHAVNDSTAKCNTLSCDGSWPVDYTSRWQAAEFVDGGKRRRNAYDNRAAFNCMRW